MPLTPSERKKIYEEEKARIEAQEQLKREKHQASESTINLSSNVVGVLCYLGIWVTGIVFFVLEQKNKWIRFHACQSIVVFGGLSILTAIFGWIPLVGWVFSTIIWICGFVLWLILMAKAYQGERFKLPFAGDIAEAMVGITFNTSDDTSDKASTPPPTPGKKAKAPPAAKAAAAAATPIAAGAIEEKPEVKTHIHRHVHRQERSIAGPSFGIFWSIVLLIVFNFFHQYIAYYTYHAATKSWTWQSFFTNDISVWLPVLNAALAVTIAGNIVLIVVNNKIVHNAIHFLMNGLSLASVLTLLIVFPFNFDVIPNSEAAGWTTLGVRIFLIIVAVGIGIALITRFAKLLVHTVNASTASD